MTDTDLNLRVHKIALDPNDAQETFFRQCAEVSRDVYNWAFFEWKRMYEAGEKPSAYALQKRFTQVRNSGNLGDAHLKEVPSNTTEHAIAQVGEAFKRFFKGQTKYPRQKKKNAKDSFLAARCTSTWQPPVEGCYIKLPKIGWVKTHQELRFEGRIKSVTVSRTANRWYAAVLMETTDDLATTDAAGRGTVGVDLGVKTLAVLSNGETFEGPKALEDKLKLLRRAEKDVDRKVKGSANRQKAKARVAKIHARIANIRKDALHKLTTYLVQNFDTVVIEDLNVEGMLKNHRLARKIGDASFGEFRRQLEYKAKEAGVTVIVADRWYPSSKTCSSCGEINRDLTLSDRDWTCGGCGTRHDRDLNAAKNLAAYPGAASGSACGGLEGCLPDETGTGLGHAEPSGCCEKRPGDGKLGLGAGEKLPLKSEDRAMESAA